MCDKLGTNNLADKSLKIGSDSVHTILQVISKLLTELNEVSDTLSPLADLKLIALIHVHTHGNLGSLNNLVCLFLVLGDFFNLLFHLVSHVVTVSI